MTDSPETQDSERRHEADSTLRDRRVIERMGDPEIKKFLTLSRRLCTVGVVASIAFITVLIGRHVNGTVLELNQSIFFGVVVAVLAFALQSLSVAIRSYLENESKRRLIIVSERLFRTLFLMVCSGIVLGAAYIITLF